MRSLRGLCNWKRNSSGVFLTYRSNSGAGRRFYCFLFDSPFIRFTNTSVDSVKFALITTIANGSQFSSSSDRNIYVCLLNDVIILWSTHSRPLVGSLDDYSKATLTIFDVGFLTLSELSMDERSTVYCHFID